MKGFATGFLSAVALVAVTHAGLAQFGGGLSGSGQVGPAVKWTTVAEGQDSRITQPEQRIVTNQSEWAQLYARMAGVQSISPEQAPRIADFTRQDVIVIHTGLKRTLGHRVYVETISRPSMNIKRVETVIVSPAPGQITGQALTSPYVAIAVDRAVGQYEFKYRNVANGIVDSGHNCGCTCGKCCCLSGGHGGGGGNGNHTVRRMYNGTIVSGQNNGEIVPPRTNQGNQGQGGLGRGGTTTGGN